METDQYNQGEFKRSEDAGGLLCPLAALMRFFKTTQWGPAPNRKLFSSGARGRLAAMMKAAAIVNRIDPSRIGAHSLRSGGANAMFVAGYDSEVIKRWGVEIGYVCILLAE